jgi:hypothetical protein
MSRFVDVASHVGAMAASELCSGAEVIAMSVRQQDHFHIRGCSTDESERPRDEIEVLGPCSVDQCDV